MRKVFRPEPPRLQIGSVLQDVWGREYVVVQPGTFSVTVRMLVEGNMTESKLTVSLDTLKPVNKRVNITLEDLAKR